jgi:hypothetical protein
MVKQAFGEESMSCTQKVKTTRDRKILDSRRAKSRACSSFSFTTKGIVHKKFTLAAQTANSACYYDLLRRLFENVRRLRPEI